MAKKTGKVYFIGAGPGAIDLITLRATRLISKADVIVYAGSLVDKRMVRGRKKGAKVYDSSSMDLGAIMDVIVTAVKAGKMVARLHTGDTALFSAFREQADLLDDLGISYEVVPGVTSASGAAAALKKEFTMPDVSQTVIYTRLAGRTPVPRKESLKSLSRHNATLCVFLSAGMIGDVVRELKIGYPLSTPAAVVYRATWKEELTLTGTLKDIAKKSKDAGIKRQALIIVGNAISQSRKKSKLYDKDFSHGYRG